MIDFKRNWRKKSRAALIKCFGSKCGICGYDKCHDAFDFHHLNPTEKDEHLSKYLKNGGSWTKISIEAKKCVCLCSNCHREVHAGITKVPLNIKRFDDSVLSEEEYPSYRKSRQYDKCPICNGTKYSRLKHCSIDCAIKANGKIHLGKVELETMILIDNKSYESIGRLLNVSGNAIKKRAKRLGVKIPNRIKKNLM